MPGGVQVTLDDVEPPVRRLLDVPVVREDFEICIETHKNYATGAYSAGPLSPRHEAGVAYFQNRLKQGLGAN